MSTAAACALVYLVDFVFALAASVHHAEEKIQKKGREAKCGGDTDSINQRSDSGDVGEGEDAAATLSTEEQVHNRALQQVQKKLCAAIKAGNIEEVRKLLEEDGADPSVPEADDPTRPPVFLAAGMGHVAVTKLMLECNADPNTSRTLNGMSMVSAAAWNGDDECVKLLLEHNADPNLARTDDGSTAAFSAVQNGNAECLKMLLEYNVDPNTPDKEGKTPLQAAAKKNNFTVAALLVAHGADPTTATATSAGHGAGCSLLYLAAEAGAKDLVEQLIKCERGVALPTQSGRADIDASPLDVAKHNHHSGIVQLLTAALPAAANTGGGGGVASGGNVEDDGAEQQHQSQLSASATTLPPHIAAILTAESPLLPPPPPVQYWLDYGPSPVSSDRSQRDLAQQATKWLVQAVQAAHESPRIKAAGRELMACFSFTCNLGYFRCWDDTLIPDLKAVLATHGETAKQANAASNLAATLTTTAILAAAPYNLQELPDGHATPREHVRQDVLMPSLTAAVSTDYDRDWKSQPEHIYAHMLLLVATALNPLFGAELSTVASDLREGAGNVQIHAAAIKSFTRMINKLMSADDHLYVKQKPRPAMNIDVVRRLAAAETAEGVVELIKQLAARFGGLSYLKCLPELAASDPAAADARYHMLPVMVTVVFAPRGLTVGDLLADLNVHAAWAELRAARPSKEVSSEQWQLDHDTAVRLLKTKCDPSELVKMHCEVQVVTAATAKIRHMMHEVYKVVRASSGSQLHADVAKPEEEEVFDDAYVNMHGKERALYNAAFNGRIATVKRLLLLKGRDNGGDEGGGSDGGDGSGLVDVNWRNEGGVTAVNVAATCGHLPGVIVLLAHNADPNLATTTDGTTPVYMAAQNGYVDIVRVLLEHNADPSLASTAGWTVGWTPVLIAAGNGHAECLKLLLEHNANPNLATADKNGYTPLLVAASNGDVNVVKLLLENNAHPNQAGTETGATPLSIATENGHVDVVNVLLEHNATPNQAIHSSDFAGQSPIGVAAECGHLNIINVLVDAGAQTGNVLTSNGATDLWVACWKGHIDVARYLLAQPNVEVNRRRSDRKGGKNATPEIPHPGTTPLEVAVLEGHTAIADLLVQHGAV